MKKFTIFLLTFLLFVGFMNSYVSSYGQSRATQTITATTTAGLFCGAPSDGEVGGTFSLIPFQGTGNDPVSNRVVYWTVNPALLDFTDPDDPTPIDPTGTGWNVGNPAQIQPIPGAFYFGLLGTEVAMNITPGSAVNFYFFSVVTVQQSAGVFANLVSNVVWVEVTNLPTITIEPLIGTMCGPRNQDIKATLDWVGAPDSIGYQWTHTPYVGTPSSTSGILHNPTFPELLTKNLALNTGVHQVNIDITIYDQYGNPSPTCAVSDLVEFRVEKEPTVTITTSLSTDSICDSQGDFTLTATCNFDLVSCEYNRVLTLAYGDTVITNTTQIAAAGSIGSFTFPVEISRLTVCSNPLTVTLAINNLKYCGADSVTVVANCPATADTTIYVFQEITAVAGDNKGTCSDEPSIDMTANDPSGDATQCTDGTGTWSIKNDHGFTGYTMPTAYNSTVNFTGISGIYPLEFYWTVTNGPCQSVDSVVLVVVEQPNIDISFSNNSFCETAEKVVVTLATTTDYNCDVRYTYNLYMDGGMIASITDTIAGTPPAFATDVLIENNLSCGTHQFKGEIIVENLDTVCGVPVGALLASCSDTTTTQNVEIFKFIQAQLGLDTALCGNTTLQLDANDPVDQNDPCTENATGAWSVDPTSDATYVSFDFPSHPDAIATFSGVTATQTFKLVWTITNGDCVDSDTLEVTIHELPVVDLTDTTACTLNVLDIIATITYPADPATNPIPYIYTWEHSADIIPMAGETLSLTKDIKTDTLSINTDLPATGTVMIMVEDNFGCKAYDTAVVIIYPLPEVSLEPLYGFCVTESPALITATPSGGEVPYEYYWEPDVITGTPDNTWSTPNTFDVNTATPATGSIIVTIRDVNGCMNKDTADVLIIDPTVTIDITPIPSPICNYAKVNLKATATIDYPYPSASLSYNWVLCYKAPSGDDCINIGLTDLAGFYDLNLPEDVTTFEFILNVHHDNFSTFCDQSDTSNTVTLSKSIKVEGGGLDTICHGGSVKILFDISNYDLDLTNKPVYYRWLQNEVYYEGADQLYMLQSGATQVSFTTDPSLHTNEEGPASYCYQLDIWQGEYPDTGGTDPLNPKYCHTISSCHEVMVLKDPVVTLSGPLSVAKGISSVEFTANVVGGNGDPIFTWYVNGVEQTQTGNPFVLTDTAVLRAVGDYDIAVKVKQTYPGCESKLVVHYFNVTCGTGTVSIAGLNSACVGDAVTLTAIVVSDVTDYIIKWKRDGQYVPGVNGPNYSFTVTEPIDVSTIQVEISFCECELTVSPVHLFQAIPNTVAWVENYDICENGTVDVQVNHISWEGQIYRYVWYNVDSLLIDSTFVNHRLFSYSADTLTNGKNTFFVQIELLNAACPSNLAAFEINVIDSLKPVTIIADTITCVKNPVYFTLNDPNGNGFGTPTVSWWVDGIEVPGWELDYINIPFNTAGTHYVYAHITYPNNNCGLVTNQIAIHVREILNVEIAGPHQICETPTYLYAVVDPIASGNMTYTYHWYLNNAKILGNDTLPINLLASPVPYIYTVFVIDSASGCVQQSLPFDVNVIKYPNIGITADKTEICANEIVMLEANVAEHLNMSYQWYTVSNGTKTPIPGAVEPIFYVSPGTTTTYTFTATQINTQCVATSNNVAVNVITTPILSFNEVKDTICRGEQKTFTYTSVPELTGATYTWYVNGAIEPGATTNVFTYDFDHHGIYVVEVTATTNIAGCVSNLEKIATITVKNNPTVVISGPDFICNTTAATPTLMAIVDPTNASVSYQWYEDGNVKGTNATQPINVTSSPYPYTYVVAITDTQTNCTVKSAPHTVMVEAFPTVGITADKTQICPNEIVMLSAAVTDHLNMNYQWYTVVDGNKTPILGAVEPIFYVSVSTTTTYTFTATQIGSECQATSNNVAVNVIQPPVLTLVEIKDTICTGQQKTFTASSNPVLTGVTYTWYINGSVQDATTNVFTPIFDQAGIFVVEVTATTNVAGCTSNLATAGTITVKNNPTVKIAGPDFVCNTQNPTALIAVLDPTGATVTYKWYEHGTLTGNTNPTQFVSTVPSSIPYIYIVEVTDYQTGCVVKSAPHSVTVEQYPTVAITADKLVVCAGEMIVLTAAVSGNNNTTYQWYANNVAIPGATSPVAYVVPQGSTQYSFIATQLGSSCFATSNVIPVTVIPTPIILVTTPTVDIICQGEQAVFTATVTTQNPVTYTWYINNQIIEGVTGNVLTYIFDLPGVFEVTVSATTDDAGCTSHIVPAGTITVKAAPTVKIDGVNAICDAVNPPVLYAIVTPLNATVTYQWFENGIPVGTEPTQVVNAAPSPYPYVYTVTITDLQSGCEVTSAPHTVYVTAFNTVPISTQSDEKICIGTQISIIADVSGLTNVVYQWFIDNTPIIGETGSILNFTPPAIGHHTFTFTVTQVGSGCTVGSNVINIEVIALPEKPVLTISDNMICSGNPVTVSGDVDGTYVWYKNGATTDFVLQTIVDQPTANNVLTTYTYTAIVTVDGCSSEISDPVSVVVHPEINPVIYGEHYVCDQALGNEHLMLHAHVAELPGVNYIYNWYYVQNGPEHHLVLGYGPDVQVPNNLPINDPSAPYYFYVEVIAEGYDCIKTSLAHEVHILPKPVVTLTVDHANICQDGAVTVTAHVSPGVPTDYTYTWTLNGNPLPFIDDNVITPGNWIIGVNTIEVKVQRDYVNLACFSTADINVNVLTAPSLVLTQDIAGLQLPGMCAGGQVNLYATVVDFDETLINIADFTYEWRRNGNPIVAPYNFFSEVLNNPGTYNYEVRAYISSLGCYTPWTAFDPVKVVPQATIAIHPKDYIYYEVCEGAQIQIDNVLNIQDPTIQAGKLFCWNDLPNDCEPFTTQIDPRMVVFNTIGLYSFFLNVEFMNPTCNAITSNTWTFDVKTNPVWTEITVDPEALCLGETVTLAAAFKGGVNEGQNIGTIQWMYSLDGGIPVNVGTIGANKQHTPTQAGSYTYSANYVPSNPLSGCHVDPYEVPVEVSAAPSARFAQFGTGDETIITCADNSYKVLDIIFEGMPPFTFQILETPGSVKTYTSTTNIYHLAVSPAVTTQYTLVYLQDYSKCSTSTFTEGYVTVQVVDIEVVNPYISTCDTKVDLYFNVKNVVNNPIMADIDFAGTILSAQQLKKVGNQYVLTIDIPANAIEGENEVIITIDGCEYTFIINVGEPLKATFTDIVDDPAKLQICANNPATKNVSLHVVFEGTPPFNFIFTGTDGTRKEMVSYIKDMDIIVTPSATTTYYIESLTDGLNCVQQDNKPEVTITVTDVEILTPDLAACGDPISLEFILISSVEKKATIMFTTFNKTWSEVVDVTQGYNSIAITIPSDVDYGTIQGTVIIDGCDFTFNINYGGGANGNDGLIHRRWENYFDVLIVSNNGTPGAQYYNGGYAFTSYQWYKNGVLIPGATQQYYQDPNGVNGIYSVKLTGYKVDAAGNHIGDLLEFMTCGQEFNPSFTLKVYPVPAQVNQPVWVEIDLTPEELEGAVLDIYDAKGAHVQHISVVSNKTLVDGFKAQGTYFGKITTGTNDIKAVKFIIVN